MPGARGGGRLLFNGDCVSLLQDEERGDTTEMVQMVYFRLHVFYKEKKESILCLFTVESHPLSLKQPKGAFLFSFTCQGTTMPLIPVREIEQF